jgi:hypothetical protein
LIRRALSEIARQNEQLQDEAPIAWSGVDSVTPAGFRKLVRRLRSETNAQSVHFLVNLIGIALSALAS